MIRRNLSWLAVSQAVRLVTGLLVGTWLTRTLGPEQNGLLGTAIVIGSILGFVAEFGLRQILIKELAVRRDEAPVIFGTAARLMFFFGLGCLVLGCGFAGYWGGGQMLLIGVILYAPMPLNACVAILSRWDASQQAQRTARLALGANLAASLARIGCILAGADLRWVAASIALETVVTAGFALHWAWRQGWAPELFGWDAKIAAGLLRESLPHFLAHSGTLLLLRVDQLMVFHISGAHEAGIYAAATRLSEITYAAGPLMIMTFLPVLSVAHQNDPGRYAALRGSLFGCLTLLAYGSAALWILAGKWIVDWVYGAAFEGVFVVLAIHGLAALPYLHGELRGAVLVIEKKTVWSVRCALAGLLLNVLLNLWLVPAHGAAGAAWATGAAYLLVWFVSSLVLPSLRSIGWQQLSALLAPFRLGRELAAIKALTA